MPCGAKDVLGRVHIGVLGVAAAGARELGSALARVRIHHLAPVTRLRGVGGVDQHHLGAGLACGIAQRTFEAVPPLVQDDPVESGLLAYLLTGRFHPAPGTGGHVGGAQLSARPCCAGLSAAGRSARPSHRAGPRLGWWFGPWSWGRPHHALLVFPRALRASEHTPRAEELGLSMVLHPGRYVPRSPWRVLPKH